MKDKFIENKIKEFRKEFNVFDYRGDNVMNIVGKTSGLNLITKPLEAFLSQALSEARREERKRIRTKFVQFAIENKNAAEELKGLILYIKTLMYLDSLNQEKKKEQGMFWPEYYKDQPKDKIYWFLVEHEWKYCKRLYYWLREILA